MGKYSKALLEGEAPAVHIPETGKYSTALLDPESVDPADIRRDWTPDPDEIDTRTSKPTIHWTPSGETPARFSTHAKSGIVDDMETKMRIYAADRFPDTPEQERMARYGIVDGEIVYVGEDGHLYPEVQKQGGQAIKRGVGEMVPRLPGMFASGAASTMGPVASATVAAGAEGLRKVAGSLIYDEPQTAKGNAIDMGLEAGFTLLGEGGGKVINKAGNALKARKAGALKYTVGDEVLKLSPEKHAMAQEIQQLAEKWGVELLPHQAYNDPRMINIMKYLRQHPQTAGAVREVEELAEENIESAFERMITAGLDPEKDAWEVGTNLQEAADRAVEAADKTRTAAVKPLYDKARDESLPIDTQPVLDEIDKLLETSKGHSKVTLRKVREMLTKEPPKTSVEDQLQGQVEDLLNGAVPEDRFSALDEVKKEIDAMVQGPDALSIQRGTKRKLLEIKDRLTDIMDKASPAYPVARAEYAKLSPAVESIKKSVVGRIGKLEGDSVVKGIDMLFNPSITPAQAKRARFLIEGQDRQAWRESYYAFMRNHFEKLKVTEEGKVNNAAGKLYKSLFGTKKHRAIMKAVTTDEEYRTLNGFFTVMKHAGIGHGKESMTMPFAAIENELTKNAGSSISKLAAPVQLLKDKTFGTWNDIVLRGNQDELLKALTQKKAVRQVAQMRKLSPKTQKFWRILGAFLGSGTGGVSMNKWNRMTVKDRYPEIIKRGTHK